MELKIALAGNPNCGKTTLFNALTGSNQYVGNWPGVTVEKKEGKLKGHKEVVIQDLPGIYSLSPYTLEEVVARSYLVGEKPDAILNIVDGTNIERNLYLTTQLIELGIPVVVAVNMIDLVRKSGDTIDLGRLGEALGCEVVSMSALKGEGGMAAAEKAVALAKSHRAGELPHVFTGSVEHAIAHIEESIAGLVDDRYLRWYAIKVFERDDKVMAQLNLTGELKAHLEAHIADCEKELDDDAESIITNQRYAYINGVVNKAVKKKAAAHSLTTSDKIDRIVTNRILALPIFAVVMFAVYYVAIGTVGDWVTGWTNDVLFGEIVPPAVSGWLEGIGTAPWLQGLIVEGIIAGVGGVLSFLPQIALLFFFLSFLEDIGYMSRAAFIMDRLLRRFGLSGKAFIPMLMGFGCSVPAIMGARTMENEKDRRMTILLVPFMSCSAKIPIYAVFAAAFFPQRAALVMIGLYAAGMLVGILMALLIGKTVFRGNPVPFVMELPNYRFPSAKSVFLLMWDKAKDFLQRAFTIIFVATVLIWFLQSFDSRLNVVADSADSLLAMMGHWLAPVFAPLGFDDWRIPTALITGFSAKEAVVSTMAVLTGTTVSTLGEALGAIFSPLAAFSFLTFTLLYSPCVAAIAAVKREMRSGWGAACVALFQCAVAWVCACLVYQIGSLFLR